MVLALTGEDLAERLGQPSGQPLEYERDVYGGWRPRSYTSGASAGVPGPRSPRCKDAIGIGA